MKKINLCGEWNVKEFEHSNSLLNSSALDINEYKIKATVPGDIHNDLKLAGIIEEPYYSDNMQKCKWVTEKDWCFIKSFDASADAIGKYNYINLFGVDTFADVYLNGIEIGKTENMFLKYSFLVNGIIKEGKNTLAINVKSIKAMMEQFPEEDFFACFNIKRIFIRKTQCHFSWDWAPEFPATGIWNDVTFESHKSTYFDSVAVRASIDGVVTVHLNLEGYTYYENEYTPRYATIEIDDGEKFINIKKEITEVTSFAVINIENPKLWWPIDLGEPFLYNYKVTLYENNEISDEVKGRFGIREVELEEKPKKNEEGLTYQVKINGVSTFLKGANWVPLDLLTGTIEDEKYHKSIDLAINANFNTLRV